MLKHLRIEYIDMHCGLRITAKKLREVWLRSKIPEPANRDNKPVIVLAFYCSDILPLFLVTSAVNT